MVFNLYVVNSDGSKTLLETYDDYDTAIAAMTISATTYSIESYNRATGETDVIL